MDQESPAERAAALRRKIAEAREQRAEEVHSALLGIRLVSARHLLPLADEFRKFSAYVDVEHLRTIEDPVVIEEMFTELRAFLLDCATSLESIDAKR